RITVASWSVTRARRRPPRPAGRWSCALTDLERRTNDARRDGRAPRRRAGTRSPGTRPMENRHVAARTRRRERGDPRRARRDRAPRIPFVAVVGDREVASHTLAIRARDARRTALVDDALSRLAAEAARPA